MTQLTLLNEPVDLDEWPSWPGWMSRLNWLINYSGVRVIASRILHEIFLLIGELAIRRTSFYDELIFQN